MDEPILYYHQVERAAAFADGWTERSRSPLVPTVDDLIVENRGEK